MTARFFHPAPIRNSEQITLGSDTSHHAVQVLRLKQGDGVILFDGTGGEFSGHLAQASKSGCQVQIESHLPVERESPLKIELAQAICINEKMDWIIQKAVEQGVTRIQPLITRRTLIRLDEERAGKRWQHWHKIIIAACEQCGRNTIPQLLPLLSLAHWLEQKLARKQQHGSLAGHHIMFSPTASQRLAKLSPPGSGEYVTFLTGPEGGFAGEETDAACYAGFIPVRLGSRILRTESAALAAIAAAQTLWGDY
ncbi:16S rRNA (uracil(1498)-N(3))-methyltransferase [Nitrosomonas sp.]|uniref:16S rRNA (uracil(1498)-N(3))-methyltransferase n=1 Tax=Nitrosomonas sp. TaxID=42353 RepID=UPI0025F30A7B|nr:16S rRNA (uracil(1498)-N(3))-methyltransferase [Nitrosomonas sp.]MCC6916014.1 16S rRNA (uracil(1498)-N(3))-methyltransferase [Nitrosomonas sp.]